MRRLVGTPFNDQWILRPAARKTRRASRRARAERREPRASAAGATAPQRSTIGALSKRPQWIDRDT
jgi:hypothetical protein